MKVSITIEVNDQMRRAIEQHNGRGLVGGKAPRGHVKLTLLSLLRADLDHILADYLNSDEGGAFEEEILIEAGALEPNYGPNDSRRRE